MLLRQPFADALFRPDPTRRPGWPLAPVFAASMLVGFFGCHLLVSWSGLAGRIAAGRIERFTPVFPAPDPAPAPAHLASQRATPSRLSIFTSPGARVWLDGRDLGTTPVVNQQVAPGFRRLVFTRPTKPDDPREIAVEVAPSIDLRVSYDFETGRSSMLAIAP